VNVQHAVVVAAPPATAFDSFTGDIDRWWPRHEGFAYGGERTVANLLDARVGGRFAEVFADGDELRVGDVVACEPPDRIVFTWRPPGWNAATEVEVTFAPEGEGTRVTVEHRFFERLGPEADDTRRGFAGGWPTVMGHYARHVSTAGA
jgi:uncharacterized protein YndB with AHSA1/START domain